MKKLLIFALLLVPMTAFAASSVRVLGTGTTPGAGTKVTAANTANTARVTPAKATAAKPAAASAASTAATSRIGTIRVKPKTTATGTLTSSSSGTTSSGSRFPVITPAHSYKTVGPQQAQSSTVQPQPVAMEDDPRFDMIRTYQSEEDWRRQNNDLVNQRVNENYVFMWVEE